MVSLSRVTLGLVASGLAICGLAAAQAQSAATPEPRPLRLGETARPPAPPSTAAAGGYTYVHHPVSTQVPAAQSAFDRGLTLLFAYQPEEGEQAFRQAARLDPALAMAWWGVALSVGPNINEPPTPEKTVTAADALARATDLAVKQASESERDYIAALSTRYSSAPNPDFDELATTYRDAMRALVQKYPDDADARALFAEAIMDLHPWRLWKSSGEPEVGTQELVDTIEQGLAGHPDHIGLLHFYIHAVEASRSPERALPAARRLAALPMEPAAAHLVHMPAHIYMRAGEWQEAIEANEHATHHALDFKLSNNPKAKRACGHCADFLSYAYMMQGNLAHARLAAENYQNLSDDPSNSIAVLVRFRKWDDMLAFADPGQTSKTSQHDTHALLGFWHFGRGVAFVGKKQIDQAQKELDALRAETSAAPLAANFEGAPDVQHVLDKITKSVDAYDLKIATAILSSRIAEARRQFPQALEQMRTAVRLQDDMPYGEPPPWFYPVRESLGALLLRHGSASDAESVFRECLRRYPHDPRAVLGLSAALQAKGERAQAAAERQHFVVAWQFSDVSVSVEEL